MSWRESEVRSYSRIWPVVFERAKGSWLYTDDSTAYLDFFAGAGTINYGHNNPILKQVLIDYLQRDGITHSLDMWTTARANFLEVLQDKIISPRGLDYKVVFPGPAGTNAVESALKLARKATGRRFVGYFKNAFHGMTLGAVSVCGKSEVRRSTGVPLSHTIELPYDGPLETSADIEARLEASSGDLSDIAAVIVEIVQGEGGVNVARGAWIRELSAICRHHGILLIIDDIQMGCGRIGPFFSFEDAGIQPDMVCLSKSISGYGLPMALTLIRPELDVWTPGEHNGTFRGFNLAFEAAAETIRVFWSDRALETSTRAKAKQMFEGLQQIAGVYPDGKLAVRGCGLVWALQSSCGETASLISKAAFKRGLLVETCGPKGEVVKLMPPLTVSRTSIDEALDIIEASVKSVFCGTSVGARRVLASKMTSK